MICNTIYAAQIASISMTSDDSQVSSKQLNEGWGQPTDSQPQRLSAYDFSHTFHNLYLLHLLHLNQSMFVFCNMKKQGLDDGGTMQLKTDFEFVVDMFFCSQNICACYNF